MTNEAQLHYQVTEYLRLQYPKVLFRTDMGGVRLTPGQARRAAQLQAGRAWPDLFIAEARPPFYGLFIELKATNIYKRDGTLLSSPHLAEQDMMLHKLRAQGYQALFAVGFNQAKEIIDDYLYLQAVSFG